MVKKMFWSTAVVATLVALLLIFSGPATATNQKPPNTPVLTNQPQDGTQTLGSEEPCNVAPGCLFYAGDFDPNGPNPNGLWNGVDNFFGLTVDGTVWVPVTVPKHFKGAKGKTDWNVMGLFANNQDLPASSFGPPSATSATFSIVQGVVAGGSPGSVTTFCAGTAPVTETPTGRFFLGFFEEFTYVVTVSGCPVLEAGTYWMTVVAQAPAPPAGFEFNYNSDVEDSTPMNALGPGTEPVDLSFFTSTFFGFPSFTATAGGVCGSVGCDRFSDGVIGTTTKK